jgi:hypothetical protein
MSVIQDRDLLTEVLESDIDDKRKTIAEDMLAKLDMFDRPLTPAQRKFAQSMLTGERFVPEEKYENLVSSGQVPRGKEVELNVGPLPLRPPARRA